MIETACKVLESDDHGDDVIALRTGITMLDRAYDALDRAIVRMRFIVRERMKLADHKAEENGGRRFGSTPSIIVLAYNVGNQMGFLTGGGRLVSSSRFYIVPHRPAARLPRFMLQLADSISLFRDI